MLWLAAGLVSCKATYFAMSETDLSQVDWDSNVQNYIPLMDSDLEKSPVLDSAYTLIAMGKWPSLKIPKINPGRIP